MLNMWRVYQRWAWVTSAVLTGVFCSWGSLLRGRESCLHPHITARQPLPPACVSLTYIHCHFWLQRKLLTRLWESICLRISVKSCTCSEWWLGNMFPACWNTHLTEKLLQAHVDTLRNNGSKRALPDGLRFYPEPFASEEPCFEETVCQGFSVRLRFPLRTLYIKQTFLEHYIMYTAIIYNYFYIF